MPTVGAIRDDVLRFLLVQTRAVVVQAGEFFFRENAPASSMYVLEAGHAALIKGWQGHDTLLHTLGRGDYFGETALTDLFPRSASVQALEESLAIELAAADLLRLLERDAEQFALIHMNIGRESAGGGAPPTSGCSRRRWAKISPAWKRRSSTPDRRCPLHHPLRNSRSFRKTVRGSG